MPLPSASTPQRSHVDGMNCIQPTAPAELGPMLPPKFDSILLIAASTFQGIPYAAPARCQSCCSAAMSSRCTSAGGVVNETGIEIALGEFGVAAVGSVMGMPERAPDEIEKPRTGGPAALADPASRASAATATTRRRISLPLRRGGATEPPVREAAPPAAALLLPFSWRRRRRAAA